MYWVGYKMKVTEKNFDIITGEETIIERDETAAETKLRLDSAKESAAALAAVQAKETARAEILNRLGLTAEEAAILLS
jgi:hypothetical protein